MMINSELNDNAAGSGEIAIPAHDKQLVGALKKTALRDMQNENIGSALKNQASLLPGGGRLNGDTVKVCGTKRLMPERPCSSQGFPSSTGMNENVVNARRRFDLELGRGKLQNNVENKPYCMESKSIIDQLQHEVTQKITQTKDNSLRSVPVSTAGIFLTTGPSVPSSLSKHSLGRPVCKVSPELPHAVDSKSIKDQQRAERFIRLQYYLKQCDEPNKREHYIQMLTHLPAVELSKYAVELERRAIQLTFEEGNEIQRMRALNILAKPPPTNYVLPSVPAWQPNKS